MSFGYGVGDIITVTTLALKTIQSTRQACGQYDELTREATSLHIVLKRLQLEAEKPSSLLSLLSDEERQELGTIINGCRELLKVLNAILEKYRTLGAGEDRRGATKLWQRVRFGNGEMQDLTQIRGQISSQTATLALFLHLTALGSQGRVERQLAEQVGALQEAQQLADTAVPIVAMAGDRASSILTNYENDDKDFWKEFRRDLIAEGCSSDVMTRHRDLIMDYIRELESKGVVIGGKFEDENSHGNQTVPEAMPTTTFDPDDEAMNLRIYTRVMASASVRNSTILPETILLEDISNDWPSITISSGEESHGIISNASHTASVAPESEEAKEILKYTGNTPIKPVKTAEISETTISRFIREYRVAVLGAGGVDKSSLVIQLTQSQVIDAYALKYDPRIEDSYRKQCVIDDEVAILDVLDTAGQEEYSAMREQYMRTGEGFMLVYSITSRGSLDYLMELRQQILRVKDKDYFPMIVVGNHCDRVTERLVSTQEGRALAKSFGCPFCEVSTHERINIESSFFDLVREIRRYQNEQRGWWGGLQDREAKVLEKPKVSPSRGSLREFLRRGPKS